MEVAGSSVELENYQDELNKPEDHNQVKNILEDNNAAFVILLNAFQYLSVPDLLKASQVSKIWNFVGSHDILWKKIVLKNCYLNDHNKLSKKMLMHGTHELDIQDALPLLRYGKTPSYFWKKIFRGIKPITTLKKVKFGHCPMNSLSMISKAAPQLKSFSSSQLSNRFLNLTPLKLMTSLEELSLEGTENPILLTNVSAMEYLTGLRSLSMKKMSNLGELAIHLPIGLRSLDISWYFRTIYYIAHHIDMSPLSKLVHIKNLSLSDETNLGITLTNTSFLKSLNELASLSLDRVYCADLLENLPPGLRSLAFDCNSIQIDLRALSKLTFLNVLVIRDYNKQLSLKNAYSINSLKHLTSLTLIGIQNLNDVENFLPTSLESLEMGECHRLTSDFINKILPTLIFLKRLELECGMNTFSTADLLNAVAVMPNLTDLSLRDLEFKRGFEETLSRCTNLVSLHITPYRSLNLSNLYSMNIHQRIIYAVASLKENLKYFDLGINCNYISLTCNFDERYCQKWLWNSIVGEELASILFIDRSCPCLQVCNYPFHINLVSVEHIEKEIFPQILPKTRASISKVENMKLMIL